jgi:hypothetical protein
MIHLSTLHPRSERIATARPPAILAAAPGRRVPTRHAARTSTPPRHRLRYLVLLLFLLTPLPNRARSSSLRIPFRTAQSMIIVQAKINGTPVTLLLDTGATRTIVSADIYGKVPFRLRTIERNARGPGIFGDSLILPVNLELANHMWAGERVAIMNLDGLSQVLGIHFDGLLGQDVLREFHSVRIDYRAHTIELEN